MRILITLSILAQLCRSSNWGVCETHLHDEFTGEHFTLCDLCYVDNRDLKTAKQPKLTLVEDKMLTTFGCFGCSEISHRIVPFLLKSASFDGVIDMYFKSGSQKYAGVFTVISFTNATYEYVIKVTEKGLESSKATAPWMFARTKTHLLGTDPTAELLSLLSNEYNTTLTSYLIDVKDSPLEYNIYSALGMEAITLLVLSTVILLKKCDRKNIVYSLDQFVDCSSTNRRNKFSVYIARFNKLASFFGVFFLIFFSVAVTLAPMFMKYFYYVGYGVCGSTACMFLVARFPMTFQRKCKFFTRKPYQMSFIVVTAIFGATSTLIIILFKDETVFRFENLFSGMCLKVLPFWFTVNFMIVVALLAHITFRSYVELALFEVGCIIMDQVFRTALFVNSLHENKELKPFLDFYYMYGDSVFQVNQGYKYENSSFAMNSFEPHTTPTTNPFVFKFHWHYRDFACQVPYNRFYPIWFITIPGFAFLHSYHYNAEQSERPSNAFPVLILTVVLAGSVLEETIRIFFDIPLAIGIISFSMFSLFSLLWFWSRKEIGDFVKGVYIYVSRSHVSSGKSN